MPSLPVDREVPSMNAAYSWSEQPDPEGGFQEEDRAESTLCGDGCVGRVYNNDGRTGCPACGKPVEMMARSGLPCTEPRECKSCKAPVLWAKWPRTQKWMPVDVKPVAEGDIILRHRKSENLLLAEKLEVGSEVTGNRYLSHFSTCPNSKENRSQRAPAPAIPDDGIPF